MLHRTKTSWRLLGLMGALVLAFSLSSCCSGDVIRDLSVTDGAWQEGRPATSYANVKPNISGDREGLPGSVVFTNVGLAGQSELPDSVNYAWRLPPGVADVHFSGWQPDEQRGSTYLFRNVPGNTTISASYTLPHTGDSGSWFQFVEATYGDVYQVSTWEMQNLLHPLAQQRRALSPAGALAPAAPQDDYWYWHTVRGFTSEGVTMTQDLAPDVLTTLQGEGMFYAMKVPAPPSPPTQSLVLPVVFQGAITPTLQLTEFAPGQPTVITAPVEYRLDRIPDLNNAMPPAEGKMWVPLGLSPDAMIFPTQPFTLAQWDFLLDLTFDLGGAPEARFREAAQAPEIETYYCFEGSGQTRAATLLAGAFGGDAATRAFSQAGFTCVGPQPLHLVAVPALQLLPAAMVEVLPGQPIPIHHYVEENEPLTVTLDLSSTLNAGWALYAQPDLTEPISPGVTEVLVEGRFDFWVAGTIPADTSEGAYYLEVSATPVEAPAQARLTRDIIWVGDWQPPARYRIYLPLVRRQSP